MSRKDACTVYTINGFMAGRPGEYRIVILARTREDAISGLGLEEGGSSVALTVSRDTMDWTVYDEHTSIGDIFVTPRGTHKYQPVDADEIEL